MSITSRLSRFARFATPLVVAVAITSNAAAAQMGRTALNVDDNGVILHGYDAVSFQTEMRAQKGLPEFTASHDGAIYRFASAANRDAFRASPAKFAPGYGGYCAMGVALGKKLDIDPAAFSLHDGRLYLNVNQDVKKSWSMDVPGNLLKADRNWSKVSAVKMFDKM